ncbi:MAG TPA: hypothetical protein VMM36_14110, partial [Opitutaceae bacterium]|nr:hypothetical protein [Opitutaceae bacterium]
MKLHEIAHARAGDKGDTSDISVFAYEPRDYPILEAELTVERVRAVFNGLVGGRIERHLLPQLGAIKFVLRGALGGGVTRSLALDAHGKCCSSILLDMEIMRRSHEARSDDEML